MINFFSNGSYQLKCLHNTNAKQVYKKGIGSNLAGALRPTCEPKDGRSCRTVLSECVSRSNCSAPTVLTALHLYNVFINLGMKDLRCKIKLSTQKYCLESTKVCN